MDKKTVGIIATILTALICGCASILTCVWGILLATGTPINTNVSGVQSVQTLPPTVGYVLLCLTVIFLLVPIVVGFFTLRKKPGDSAAPTVINAKPAKPAEPEDNEPLPPAS